MSSIASSRTGESFTQGNMEYSPGERSPLRRSSFTAEGGGDDCGKCLDAFGSCLGIKPHGEPQRDWTAATGTAAQPGSYTGSHSTNYGTTGPTHTSLRRDGGQSAIASGATHAKGKAPSAASMNSSVGVHAASTSAFSLASSAEGTPGAKSGVGLDDATGPFGNWKFGQLSVGGASRDGGGPGIDWEAVKDDASDVSPGACAPSGTSQ
ncbi:hypothetical protein IAT40_007421 [Kwoniella sp. CBS 6097]